MPQLNDHCLHLEGNRLAVWRPHLCAKTEPVSIIDLLTIADVGPPGAAIFVILKT